MNKYNYLIYLKDRYRVLLLLFVSFIIHSVITFVYVLPLESLVYAYALIGSFYVVFSVYDYHKELKRIEILKDIKFLDFIDIKKLPNPKSTTEIEFNSLIETLVYRQKDLIHEKENSYQEMLDYYTIWAHQIKTPIAAMRLLLQKEESTEHKELLIQLFRIEQYVEMVLGYLRIDNVNADFVFESYSLDDLVRQSVKKYASIFINKQITLNLSTLNQDIVTDEKWMVFVFDQIISNALKYTHNGSISIYMLDKKDDEYSSFFGLSHKDSSMVLAIKDTGIGIMKSDLPKVFLKGYTGYNGRRDKKATGIGLYMVKKVVDKLGHAVYIDSQETIGTTVYIDLNR